MFKNCVNVRNETPVCSRQRSPEGLSKAWAACGDSVESRVSDGSAPFCAIYRAFAKVVGRERHVVFPSSKSRGPPLAEISYGLAEISEEILKSLKKS